jgi:hypothetical protein
MAKRRRVKTMAEITDSKSVTLKELIVSTLRNRRDYLRHQLNRQDTF